MEWENCQSRESITYDLEKDQGELKQMEERPQTIQKQAEVLYDSAPNTLITVNAQGRISHLNQQAQVMFGYTRDELLDQPIGKLIHQSLHDRDFLSPHLQSIGAKLEVFAVRKDGSEFPAEIALSPLQIDGESFLTADIRDITERKQIKESLYQRNSVLEALHQTMLYLVDRRDVGDILEVLLAVIRELLKASQVSIDLIEADDQLVTRAATADQPLKVGDRMRRGEGSWLSSQVMDSGRPAVLEDYAAWDGRRELFEGYPIHAIAIVPIHQGERVIGAINVSRSEENKPFSDTDIYVAEQLAQMVALVLDNAQLYARLESELTDRRKMEETLRESRENFQRYFNMGTVGMCVTSPDMKWIETNGHLRKMLGYTDEELDRLTWRDLTHSEDLDADLVMFNQMLANERDSYKLDKRFIRKDGETVYTTMYASCYRNPDGTVRYLLASLVDITDRKEAEAALLKLTAVEERQRLARDLHDSVNQSIHSLVLFSETLTSTLERNNLERARQIAERLQESARQALKETRLLLYETQALAPERSVDLIQALESRLATVEQRAGVRTQLIQEGSLEDCPQAWSENLFWITIEALNNALKHAQARNVKILMMSSPQRLEMEIIDDGAGFDPGKPRAGGLGLRNMRERADLIGGELVIRSSPGKGTRVCFSAEAKEQHGPHSITDR
ncbi:MAG TPA: PAS domain S-box protein [Anaerolineales bacterium]|nr:PAS domain S-box protein [Anaerolineales bacterium]